MSFMLKLVIIRNVYHFAVFFFCFAVYYLFFWVLRKVGPCPEI